MQWAAETAEAPESSWANLEFSGGETKETILEQGGKREWAPAAHPLTSCLVPPQLVIIVLTDTMTTQTSSHFNKFSELMQT